MEELKVKQKRYSKVLKISLITSAILFIICVILYSIYKHNIFTVLAMIVVLIGASIASVYEFLIMTIEAKTMWIEYRNEHNLISGVFVIILIIITPLSALFVMSKTFSDEWKNIFNTMITTLITLLPALISLLGIHYSNTMQQINKSEELKNINKPYPSIECKHKLVTGANPITAISIDMTISNLANNILVPLYLKHDNIKYELSYKPITFVKPAEYKSLLIDTEHAFSELILEFSIVYKDALENLYESKFEIDLNNRDNTTLNLKEAIQIFNQKI